MRISDYPKKTDVTGGGQYFAVDSGADGTKAIEMNDIKKSAMDLVTNEEYYDFLDRIGIPWQQRRNIFRGKNLGSTYTAEQKAAIADGSFKGMFIGDYWKIGNIIYRIADINYWLFTGDTSVVANHIVIVPDGGVGANQQMNDTNTTNGGYTGSNFYTSGKLVASNIIYSAFGKANILNHRELLTDAVTNGYPSAGAWHGSEVDLMNEPMVYGSYQLTPGSNGTVIPWRHTIDKTQLSIFKLSPLFICIGREAYWLRDVVSAASFAVVYSIGYSTNVGAASTLAVRPVFGITG